MSIDQHKVLSEVIEKTANIDFAVLIGSRAIGEATPASDWDIAIRWQGDLPYSDKLGQIEVLRALLIRSLSGHPEPKVDLIDLARAGLAMRAEVTENGVLLADIKPLAYDHFLVRTWRELEEYYWDEIYAAGSVSTGNEATNS